MIQGVLNCTVTYAKKQGAKFDNEHRYDRVLKSVETSHVGKATALWTNKSEATELFLTINQTS
jgi:hypothetical protein